MVTTGAGDNSRDQVFAALADSARRKTLQLLLECNRSVAEQDVVAHLAATDQQLPSQRATPDRQTLHTDLIHRQFPKLEAASLITWDRDATTVETARHPAFDDPRFRLLLDAEVDGLNEALSNLANDRRRILLTILRDTQTPMTRRDLETELLRSDETALEPDTSGINGLLLQLHHVHLPALDDADLVEYDRDSGRATYTGHPALEEVFTIIYELDERLADSYDDFFEGVSTAFDSLTEGTDTEAEWPHSWRDASYE